MNITLIIWIADVCENLNILLSLIASLCIVSYVILFFCYLFVLDERSKLCKKYLKWLLSISIPVFFLLTIMPRPTVIYAYAGQEVAKEIIGSPQVNEILNKTQKVIVKKLDEYLEDKKK